MTDPMMSLKSLLEKSPDADVLELCRILGDGGGQAAR